MNFGSEHLKIKHQLAPDKKSSMLSYKNGNKIDVDIEERFLELENKL